MRISSFLIFLPAIVACGNADLNRSDIRDVVSGSSAAALLGMGYDSHTEVFSSACAKSRYNGKDSVRYSGAPTANLSLDRSLSAEELKNILDIEASGKLMMTGMNTSGAGRFASEAAASDLSTSLVFANKISGLYAVLNEPELTDAARVVGLTNDAAQIRSQCGDHYVEQVELGAELLVSMRFDFSNRDVKSNFEAEIDLDFVNIFQVSGAAKVAMTNYKNSVGVTISALQVGGDVTALGRIFQGDGSSGSQVMRCSIDNIDACIKTMENVVTYASSSDPGNFSSQLKNLQFDDTSSFGAANLRYITKSYFSGGLRELYKSPAPILSNEIMAARNRLLERYEAQARDRKRVSSLLNLRLSEAELQRFLELDRRLAHNIRQMVSAGQTCYEKPLACVETEAAIRLESYSSEEMNRTLEFYDYCLLRKTNSASSATIEALRASLDLEPETSCEDMEAELFSEAVVDLSQRGISDLRPLTGLNNLKVLKLSGNKIRNLETLSTFPKLEVLELRRNNISDISPLSRISTLKSLDVAYNRIVDLMPLAGLSNLKVLKAHGNAAGMDTQPLSQKFDRVYLEDNQICALERDYAFAQGIISSIQHKAYDKSNFAPIYMIPGDRSSGLRQFVSCSRAALDF
jgi:hypothetical protein